MNITNFVNITNITNFVNITNITNLEKVNSKNSELFSLKLQNLPRMLAGGNPDPLLRWFWKPSFVQLVRLNIKVDIYIDIQQTMT